MGLESKSSSHLVRSWKDCTSDIKSLLLRPLSEMDTDILIFLLLCIPYGGFGFPQNDGIPKNFNWDSFRTISNQYHFKSLLHRPESRPRRGTIILSSMGPDSTSRCETLCTMTLVRLTSGAGTPFLDPF